MSSPSQPEPAHDFASMLAESRAGCREKKGRLLNGYSDHLKHVAEAQLPRESAGRKSAEDYVQEALVQALQHFNEFNGSKEDEFCAWLHAILHRTILGEARHLGRQSHEASRETSLDAVLPGHADGGILATESSRGQELIARENRAQIEACLLELSADHREVFRLRALENRTYNDIGASLDISPGAAQARFTRATCHLRKLLEKKGFGSD